MSISFDGLFAFNGLVPGTYSVEDGEVEVDFDSYSAPPQNIQIDSGTVTITQVSDVSVSGNFVLVDGFDQETYEGTFSLSL